MKLLVCVKQVIDTLGTDLDKQTHRLVRSKSDCTINPFDLYALEAAARIKDQYPDTVITAISMGPKEAQSVLRDALAIAADQAFLICDPIFAGSDTIATSIILEKAIRVLEYRQGPFDSLFCGAKSTDGETSSIGPQLAWHLGVPVISCALNCQRQGNVFTIKQETMDGIRRLQTSFPCVISFTKAEYEPRYPKISRILTAEAASISVFDAVDLDLCDIHPHTRIVSHTFQKLTKKTQMFTDPDPEQCADALVQIMQTKHFL